MDSRNNDEYIIEGRRIIDFTYFFNNLKSILEHGKRFGCSFSNLKLITELRVGLVSKLTFQCNMCNEFFKINTSDHENADLMDINISAVTGIVSIGCGYTGLNEFLTYVDIPNMDQITFKKHHDRVCDAFETTASQEMDKAAKREKELAVEAGDVGPDGVPEITVICDGSLAKRSYKTKYNSLSGMAAIVGMAAIGRKKFYLLV